MNAILVGAMPTIERRSVMHRDEDARSPRPLEYERPRRAPFRLTYMVGVGAVVLVAGAVAAWCVVHTIEVIVEVQRVARSRPIDFDPSYVGMPVERAIPLGVFSGGVALVAFVNFVRLWNGRKDVPPRARLAAGAGRGDG